MWIFLFQDVLESGYVFLDITDLFPKCLGSNPILLWTHVVFSKVLLSCLWIDLWLGVTPDTFALNFFLLPCQMLNDLKMSHWILQISQEVKCGRAIKQVQNGDSPYCWFWQHTGQASFMGVRLRQLHGPVLPRVPHFVECSATAILGSLNNFIF